MNWPDKTLCSFIKKIFVEDCIGGSCIYTPTRSIKRKSYLPMGGGSILLARFFFLLHHVKGFLSQNLFSLVPAHCARFTAYDNLIANRFTSTSALLHLQSLHTGYKYPMAVQTCNARATTTASLIL